MKTKHVLALLGALFIMLMTTGMTSSAAAENKVGSIVKANAKIYKSASKKSTARALTADDVNRTFYVRESKEADKTTYYRIYKGSVQLGWVDKKMMKVANRTVISRDKKTMYIMAAGHASTMPATTANNRSIDLDKYRGDSVAVERHEKVGTTEWYKGKIAGTNLVRWIKADALTHTGYVGVNVRKPSNVTATELRALLLAKGKTKDNILYTMAPEFIKAQKSTGVSAQFMFAHAILETGWGSSTIAAYKNNLFGYQAYDSCPITCSKYFPTGEAGLKLYASRIVNNYLVTTGPYYNGMNPMDMNVRYATDKGWGAKIAGLMEQMKPYSSSYYKKAKASNIAVAIPKDYGSVIPNGQARPDAFVKMPSSVKAVATADQAIVYSVPYIYAARLGTYTKWKSMTIQAYHTDVKEFTNSTGGKSRWYRVAFAGTEGWVRSDQVQTKNLAFTSKAATLYQGAGTNYTKVGNAVTNTPIKLIMNSAGKNVTKKDKAKKTWYKAYNPQSPKKTMWIRSDLMKIYR